MTLTPPKFHIADDMPMSLGKAIAREIAPKVDPNAWFETYNHDNFPHGNAPRPPLGATPEWLLATGVQIKGAPSAQSQPESGQSRSETVGAPPSVQKFRVGDKCKCIAWYEWAPEWQAFEVVALLPNNRLVIRRLSDGMKGHMNAEHAELISPASETEGWVTPECSTCPVPHDTRVKFKLRGRGDAVLCEALAGHLLWGRDRGEDTITSYLVVKP